jgi:hypothetical protein
MPMSPMERMPMADLVREDAILCLLTDTLTGEHLMESLTALIWFIYEEYYYKNSDAVSTVHE